MPKLTHARPRKPVRRAGALPPQSQVGSLEVRQRAARFTRIYEMEAVARGLPSLHEAVQAAEYQHLALLP
jgi:hypothetical protein